jgi:hypothetical protein
MVLTTAIRPLDPRLRMIRCPRKTKPSLTWVISFLHIQRQLQLAFQKGTAFLADGLGMGLRPFDNDDEVIGITTIGYGRFPLAVHDRRDSINLRRKRRADLGIALIDI